MQPRFLVQVVALLVASSPALADVTAAVPHDATKEQYLECLVARSSAEARQSRLAQSERKYKERVAKFQVAEEDLNAQVRRHAPSTQHEVESYNKAIAARNASVQSLNKELQRLQDEQASVSKTILEANGKCSSLVVSPEVAKAAEEEHRKRLATPPSAQPPAASGTGG
jgi:chromosome segregation ATPase